MCVCVIARVNVTLEGFRIMDYIYMKQYPTEEGLRRVRTLWSFLSSCFIGLMYLIHALIFTCICVNANCFNDCVLRKKKENLG